MDDLRPIDTSAWPRRKHFEHYLTRVPCTYAMTVELDVTDMADALKHSSRKTYLAQIWALATIVNRHDEFRMALTESGEPAAWSVLHPSFTVFNRARETFANAWSPYDADFGIFHETALEVLTKDADATSFLPHDDYPPNTFDVSSLPWASFTGFTLQIENGWRHLAPIFTLGRYIERNGRTLLPLAVQIHHAAADGFHTARLLNELQALIADPDWVG